jgi:hypothetical protein
VPYPTPADLARIRPIDILDQAMFDDMIGSIPLPVPDEWRTEYNRLNAISRRHGFDWPYQRRTKRAKSRREPSFTLLAPGNRSHGHLAFQDDYEYFQSDDSYVYMAPIASRFDEDGRRMHKQLVGNLYQAKKLLGLD